MDIIDISKIENERKSNLIEKDDIKQEKLDGLNGEILNELDDIEIDDVEIDDIEIDDIEIDDDGGMEELDNIDNDDDDDINNDDNDDNLSGNKSGNIDVINLLKENSKLINFENDEDKFIEPKPLPVNLNEEDIEIDSELFESNLPFDISDSIQDFSELEVNNIGIEVKEVFDYIKKELSIYELYRESVEIEGIRRSTIRFEEKLKNEESQDNSTMYTKYTIDNLYIINNFIKKTNNFENIRLDDVYELSDSLPELLSSNIQMTLNKDNRLLLIENSDIIFEDLRDKLKGNILRLKSLIEKSVYNRNKRLESDKEKYQKVISEHLNNTLSRNKLKKLNNIEKIYIISKIDNISDNYKDYFKITGTLVFDKEDEVYSKGIESTIWIDKNIENLMELIKIRDTNVRKLFNEKVNEYGYKDVKYILNPLAIINEKELFILPNKELYQLFVNKAKRDIEIVAKMENERNITSISIALSKELIGDFLREYKEVPKVSFKTYSYKELEDIVRSRIIDILIPNPTMNKGYNKEISEAYYNFWIEYEKNNYIKSPDLIKTKRNFIINKLNNNEYKYYRRETFCKKELMNIINKYSNKTINNFNTLWEQFELNKIDILNEYFKKVLNPVIRSVTNKGLVEKYIIDGSLIDIISIHETIHKIESLTGNKGKNKHILEILNEDKDNLKDKLELLDLIDVLDTIYFKNLVIKDTPKNIEVYDKVIKVMNTIIKYNNRDKKEEVIEIKKDNTFRSSVLNIISDIIKANIKRSVKILDLKLPQLDSETLLLISDTILRYIEETKTKVNYEQNIWYSAPKLEILQIEDKSIDELILSIKENIFDGNKYDWEENEMYNFLENSKKDLIVKLVKCSKILTNIQSIIYTLINEDKVKEGLIDSINIDNIIPNENLTSEYIESELNEEMVSLSLFTIREMYTKGESPSIVFYKDLISKVVNKEVIKRIYKNLGNSKKIEKIIKSSLDINIYDVELGNGLDLDKQYLEILSIQNDIIDEVIELLSPNEIYRKILKMNIVKNDFIINRKIAEAKIQEELSKYIINPYYKVVEEALVDKQIYREYMYNRLLILPNKIISEIDSEILSLIDTLKTTGKRIQENSEVLMRTGKKNIILYEMYLKTGKQVYLNEVDMNYVPFELLTRDNIADIGQAHWNKESILDRYDNDLSEEDIETMSVVDIILYLESKGHKEIKNDLPLKIIEFIESEIYVIHKSLKDKLDKTSFNLKYELI